MKGREDSERTYYYKRGFKEMNSKHIILTLYLIHIGWTSWFLIVSLYIYNNKKHQILEQKKSAMIRYTTKTLIQNKLKPTSNQYTNIVVVNIHTNKVLKISKIENLEIKKEVKIIIFRV